MIIRTPTPADLDAMGALTGEDARNVAQWLGETPRAFCHKVAHALHVAYSAREAMAGQPYACPWPESAIRAALLRRMKGAE